MKYTSVCIRTREQLLSSNKYIKAALLEEANKKKKKTLPLVYEYLGTKGVRTENNINLSNVIGTISNIQLDKDGNVVCSVDINDVMAKSSNFKGIVDNVVVGLRRNEDCENQQVTPVLVNAVVYDSFAKSIIDEKSKSSESRVFKSCDSPIEDEIASDKELNPLRNPEIMESIHDELKEVM